MVKKFWQHLLVGFSLTLASATYAQDTQLVNDPNLQAFIQEVADKHQFDQAELQGWFKNTTLQSNVLAAIQKPYEGLPWYKYRKIFLKPERAEAGAKFWQEHADILSKAEAQYGVPASIIVAIIGVETYYGKYTGKHPVLDSLATLAFHYPPRAKFFKKELEQLLLLSKEENIDPTALYGSYAGALGTPQFISSSYREYAVDFNQDGTRDLLNSIEDSIGSVANYFKVHGWETNQPIVFAASPKTDKLDDLLAPLNNPKPKQHLTAYHRAGIPTPPANEDYKAALFALDTETGPAYYLGLQNFYVITRYNHSALYAMAVFELSKDIENRYQQLASRG